MACSKVLRQPRKLPSPRALGEQLGLPVVTKGGHHPNLQAGTRWGHRHLIAANAQGR